MRRILVVPGSLLEELSPAVLERRGFSVRTSQAMGEALDVAADWSPELIVLGDLLAGGDSAKLCAAVRANRHLSDTKLLLLTNFLPGDDVGAEVLFAECDAHLVQPVSEEQLLRTVGVLLDVQLQYAPRLPISFLAALNVQAHADAPERQMFVNILSLSDLGVVIECPGRLDPAQTIALQFVLPGTELKFASECIVLTSDELLLHYNCEFLHMAPDDRAEIRRFVDSQLAMKEGRRWRR